MRTGRTLALLLFLAPAAFGSLRSHIDFLARADGATDDYEVAAALDALRAMGKKAAPAAETLSALLLHQAKLYRDRDKLLVVRLRAHILVTLSEIGVPESAEWALYDTLAHGDERLTARELGAAARAVRSLGARGRDLAPFLVETLTLQRAEEEFSLERYAADYPPSEATTAQLEAVRALAAVANDDETLHALRQLASNEAGDRRAIAEARQAVETIEGGRR
jgi:hypothetical protein